MGKTRDRKSRPAPRTEEAAPHPTKPPAGPPSGGRRLLLLGGVFGLMILVILAWLFLGGGARPFRGNTSAYNVLLVTMDTTRADHLGCYGYHDIRTPILDGLADHAVLFEQAYTPAVMTLPSHASILTGVYPATHGIRDNGSYRLAPEVETLPEILKAAGYKTGAVIGSFVLDSMFGLDQGFESYDDYLPDSGSHDVFFAERTAGEITDAALRYLNEARTGRWFLWVHYFDPHSPLRPPSPFKEQYPGRAYDAEIAYMDSELGRLLAGLGEMGVRDRTMIIAVADHGEGLRDHGDHAHGVFLYDETARVPLIVDLPGFVQTARRVPAVVRTIDIMPTILDVLRLPPRPGTPGASLWPLMDAQVKDLGLAAFSEAAMPLLQFGWSPLASLRKGKWKYVEAPKPELYDMQADPKEKRNLAGTDTGTAGSLRGELQGIVTEAARSAYGSEGAGTGSEEAAKLRSLGYASARGSGREILASNPEILMEGGSRGLPDPKDRVEMLERINKVYLAFGAGDFPATVSMARAILQTDPDNDNIREYLADSFRSMQRFDDALAEYGHLLAKNPENVDALLNVGWVQMNLGRMDEARAAMEKALAIHPGHTYALASLGDLAFVQGDFGKAVEYYRKVLLQRPNHVQSIMAMAKIFERNNKLHEAEVFYKRVTEINPKNIDAWLSLGWLQFNAKEYDDALKSLEGAGRIDPQMAELNLYRGDILLALNRLDEAEAQYQQGVTKAPRAPQGYHGLGLVAERRGDAGKAQRFFEQALKANPSFAPSRAQLERLRQAGVSGG